LRKLKVCSIFFYFLFLTLYLGTPVASSSETGESGLQSNIARSEKRILHDDPVRDKKLLMLTDNNRLAGEIIKEHSLIVGSKMVLVSRRNVYSWLVEHIKVSAALSRIFGRKYYVSPSNVYEYHGDDGEGLSVDFFTAYRDSMTTILVGEGKMKLFRITFTGSFINFMEYNNLDSTHIAAQNCMYAKVNNPVARFFTHIAFAIPDIKRGTMEKLLSLDDTVFQIVKTFMEDAHLYHMLQNPNDLPPKDKSKLAVKMRDAVISESSPDDARELGKLVEQARIEAGYQK
jgi:hypothetical protein